MAATLLLNVFEGLFLILSLSVDSTRMDFQFEKPKSKYIWCLTVMFMCGCEQKFLFFSRHLFGQMLRIFRAGFARSVF